MCWLLEDCFLVAEKTVFDLLIRFGDKLILVPCLTCKGLILSSAGFISNPRKREQSSALPKLVVLLGKTAVTQDTGDPLPLLRTGRYGFLNFKLFGFYFPAYSCRGTALVVIICGFFRFSGFRVRVETMASQVSTIFIDSSLNIVLLWIRRLFRA